MRSLSWTFFVLVAPAACASSSASLPRGPAFQMCSALLPPRPDVTQTEPRVFGGFLRLVEWRKTPVADPTIVFANGSPPILKIGNERHPFGPPPREQPQDYLVDDDVVAIDRPLPPGGFLETFPFRVVRRDKKLLVVEYAVDGVIDVGGRTALVRYGLDPATGQIDGLLGIDTNGDGMINGPEETSGPVFRIGDVTVRPNVLDRRTGRFELLEILSDERPSRD